MEADDVYAVLNRKIKDMQASGSGVTDYADLDGKPQINGVTLQGNLTPDDLGLASTVDYADLENKPLINGVELNGTMNLDDLGIHNFSGDYKDLQNKPEIPIVPESLPNPHPVTFGGMLPFKSYDGSQAVNITFPDMEILNEAAGTPVGEIISYMGTVAPANYLICDGAEYPIAEYPYLAQHFNNNFGSVNFFGGDGETTFAVPDLRGEFLRGTGANSHVATISGGRTYKEGSGQGVGTHRASTSIPFIWNYRTQNTILMETFNSSTSDNKPEGMDATISGSSRSSLYANSTRNTLSSIIPIVFSVRPTNTAVLYCIKYRPTYFSQVQHTYSLEERRVGTWIDGKPLYEKAVDFGAMPNNSSISKPHGVEYAEKIWISGGFSFNRTNSTCSTLSNSNPNPEGCWVFWTNPENIFCSTKLDRSMLIAFVILHYTKTTD